MYILKRRSHLLKKIINTSFILSLILFPLGTIVKAQQWTEPAGSPPSANVPGPIWISPPTAQSGYINITTANNPALQAVSTGESGVFGIGELYGVIGTGSTAGVRGIGVGSASYGLFGQAPLNGYALGIDGIAAILPQTPELTAAQQGSIYYRDGGDINTLYFCGKHGGCSQVSDWSDLVYGAFERSGALGLDIRLSKSGSTLNGPGLEDFFINSDGNIQLRIDSNNDSNSEFAINNGLNTKVFSVNEAGDTTIGGNLNIADGNTITLGGITLNSWPAGGTATGTGGSQSWTGSGSGSLFPLDLTDNVGIGTSSPNELLTINGNLSLSTTSTAPTATSGFGKLYVNESDGSLRYISPSGQSFDLTQVQSGGTSTGSTTSNLPTGTAGQTLLHDGTAWVASSSLYNSGSNIGIGTSSPSELLSVAGAFSLSSANRPSATSGQGKLFVDSTDGLLYYVSADNTLYTLSKATTIGDADWVGEGTGLLRPGSLSDNVLIGSENNSDVISPYALTVNSRVLVGYNTAGDDTGIRIQALSAGDNILQSVISGVNSPLLLNASGSYVSIGDDINNIIANGDGALYVQGDIEVDGRICFKNGGDCSSTWSFPAPVWTSSAGGLFYGGDGVIVGSGSEETLLNAGFATAGLDAGDLFVEDELGVEGNIYTDAAFIAGSGLSISDNTITQAVGELTFTDAVTGSKTLAELVAVAGGGDFSDGGEAGGADRSLGNTDDFSLGLETNDITRIHIQNDGNIGIGTTGPGTRLAVEEDNAVNAGVTDLLSLSHTTSGSVSNGIGAGLLFNAEDNVGTVENLAQITGIFTNVENTTEAGALAFSTRTGGAVLSEAVRIDGSGNLGIGTTAPSEKLQINGALLLGTTAGTTDGTLRWTGSDFEGRKSGVWTSLTVAGGGDFSDGGEAGGADRSLGNTDDFSLGLETNDITRIHIQNDGKVGIGTTTPTSQLDVNYVATVLPSGDLNDSFEVADGHTLGAPPGNSWSGSGNLDWFIDDSDSNLGTQSARSGAITDSQTSSMEIILNYTTDGTIQYYRQVSSETNYDFLRFYIDNVLQETLSGVVSMSLSPAFTVTGAGNHTLKWTYSKDGSASDGVDTAWVDDVVAVNGSPISTGNSTVASFTGGVLSIGDTVINGTATDDGDLYVEDALEVDGTICLLNDCRTTWPISGGDFSDGGDTTGAYRTLGNNDNFGLGLETNGATRLHIDRTGYVYIGDSSSASLIIRAENTNTTQSTDILFLDHTISAGSTASVGIGSGIAFRSEDTAGNLDLFAQVRGYAANNTNGSEKGALAFHLTGSGNPSFTNIATFIASEGLYLTNSVSETILNSGFVMDNFELFVDGQAGFTESIYTNDSFIAYSSDGFANDGNTIIANQSSTTYGNGYLTNKFDNYNINTSDGNLVVTDDTDFDTTFGNHNPNFQLVVIADDSVSADYTDGFEVADGHTLNTTLDNGWVNILFDEAWTVDNTNVQAGSQSARAGVISDNETSSTQIKVNYTGNGTVQYYRKVSSDFSDYFEFYIDNVRQEVLSGEVAMSLSPLFAVTGAGDHVFRWIYAKNGVNASGSDTVWIDNVVISDGSGAGAIVSRDAASFSGGLVQIGDNINNGTATDDGDLYIEDALEVDGQICLVNDCITTWPAGGGTADFSNGGDTATVDRTLGNNDAFALGLETTGVTRLHITNSGDIGIGTEVPGAKLAIEEDNASNTAVTDLLSLSHTTSGIVGNGIGSGLLFNAEDNAGTVENLAQISGIFTNVESLSEASALAFSTRTGGAALSEAMRIDGSGNLGIGTTSPSEQLHINGALLLGTTAGTTDGTLRWTGSDFEGRKSGVWTSLTAAGGSGGDFSNGGDTATVDRTLGNNDAFALGLETNAVTRLHIDNAGLIGIGTTSPSEQLHINGALLLGTTAGTTDGTLRWTGSDFEGRKSGVWTSLTAAGGSGGDFSNGGDTATVDRTLGNNDAFALGLETTGVTRLHITNAGLVGVGTTTPGGLFEVSAGNAGDALFILEADEDNDNENDNPALKLIQDGGAVASYFGIIGDTLTLGDGTAVSSGISNSTIIGPGIFTGPLQFMTVSNTTPIVRMTILGTSGNVGIGTNAPVNILDIESGVAIGSNYSGTSTAPTNGLIVEGNVGIGTASPTGNVEIASLNNAELYISADTANTSGEGTHSRVVLRQDGGANGVTIGMGGGADAEAGNIFAIDYRSFDVDYTDIFTINSARYVGIGTAGAGVKLAVEEDDAINAAVTDLLSLSHTTSGIVGNGIGSGLLFNAEDNAGTVENLAQISGIFTNVESLSEASALAFSTRTGGAALSEAMRINGSGNVGIGTTSPSEKLQINGALLLGTTAGTTDGTLRWTGSDFEGRKSGVWTSLTAAGGSGGDFSNGGDTAGANRTLGNNDAFALGLETNAVTRLHIDNAGLIGIGTTSPSEQLHLTNNLYTEDNLFVGTTTETIVDANFILDGNDVFVEGQLGVKSTLFIDDYISLGGAMVIDPVIDVSLLNPGGTGGGHSTSSAQITNLNSAHLVFDIQSNGATDSLAIRTDNNFDGVVDDIAFVVKSTSNVGIGTVLPLNILDIGGGVAIGAAYAGTNTAPTNGLLVEGNLGVGVTSPLEKLQVVGNVLVGPSAETIVDANFVLDGNDVFVEGQLGVKSTLFIDDYISLGNTMVIDPIIDVTALNPGGTGAGHSTGAAQITNYNLQHLVFDIQSNGATDSLAIRTDNNYDGVVDDIAFVVKSTSNVGIGTVLPLNILDIGGGVAIGAAYAGTNTAPTNGLLVEGNLGVGVTSPLEKLQVNGALLLGTTTGTTDGTVRWTGSDFEGRKGGVWTSFTAAGGSGGDFSNGGDTTGADRILGNNDAFALGLETNGTTRLHIASDGKIGIGTETPGTTLNVSGTALGTNFLLNGGSSILIDDDRALAANVGGGITMGGTYTAGGVKTTFGGIRAVKANATDGNYSGQLEFFVRNHGDGDWTGDQRMVINDIGNVGIGTTSPVNNLDIEGSVAIGATYSGTTTAPTNGLIIEGDVGIGVSSPQKGLDVQDGIRLRQSAAVDSGSLLEFSDRNGVWAQGMSWNSYNNSGWKYRGNDYPALWTFSVDGDYVYLNAASGTDNAAITWNPIRFIIKNDGKIGVGTDAPGSRLAVEDDNATNVGVTDVLSLTHTTSGTVGNGIGTGLLFNAEDNVGAVENLAQIAGIFTNVETTTEASALTFSTRTGGAALSEAMRIDGSGNVGIGTTSPTEELHIIGTTNLKAKSGSDNIFFKAENSAGTLVGQMKEASTVGGGGLLFQGARTGTGGDGIFFGGYTPSGGNAGLEFRSYGGTIASPLAQPANTPVAIFSKYNGTGTDNLVTIDSDGNLGIGTTTPAEKLEVNGAVLLGTTTGTTNGTVRWTGSDFEGLKGGVWTSLTSVGGTADFSNGGDTAGANRTLGNNDAFALGLETNGTTRLHIDNAGLVGIGTASPSAVLDIDPGASGATVIGGNNFNLGSRITTTSNRSGFMASVGNDFIDTAGSNGHFISAFPFNDSVNSDDGSWKGFKLMAGATLTDRFWVDKFGNGYFAAASGRADGLRGVGIGTSAPVNFLDVAGAVALGSTYAGSKTAPANGLLVEGKVHIGAADSTLSVANTELFIEDNGGQAIIRTVGYENASTSGSSILLGKARGTQASPLIIQDGDNLGSLTFQSFTSPGVRSSASIAAYVDATPGAADSPGRLEFQTTPDGASGILETRMVIKNDGLVGIGTTGPGSRLSVEEDNATNAGVTDLLSLSHTTSGIVSSGIGTGILFNAEDNAGTVENLAQIAGIFTNVESTTETSALAFSTRTGGAALSEAMRIDGSGNLGIGTTSPNEKLEVNGAVLLGTTTGTTNGTLRWTGSDFEGLKGGVWTSLTSVGGTADFSNGGDTAGANRTLGNNDSFALGLETAGLTRFHIDNAGKVGIGTTGPGSRLSVEEDNATNAGVTDLLSLTHLTTGTAAAGIGSGILFNSEDSVGNVDEIARISGLFKTATSGAEDTALAFETRGSGGSLAERMRITEFGAVGIGTTAPVDTLTVQQESGTNGNVSNVMSIIHATSSGANPGIGAGLTFKSEDDAGAIVIAAQIAGILTDVATGTEDGALSFLTLENGGGLTERMRLHGNGDVDIATSVFFADISAGHVGVNNGAPSQAFIVGTGTSNGNGAYVTDGGTWTNGSSRTFKDRYTALDNYEIFQKVLSLDVEGWFYKETEEYHVGPYAEDFYELFGTGLNNKYLASSDVAGVALISVKYLAGQIDEIKEVLSEHEYKIQRLETTIKRLEDRLDSIENNI